MTPADSLSRKIAERTNAEIASLTVKQGNALERLISSELAPVEAAIQAANEMMYALGNIYSHGVNHPVSFKEYEDAIKSCEGWRAALSGLGVRK